MPSRSATGELFIVATPIGNLNDISQRAIQVLSEVEVILAEDTRHSKRLLNHLGINQPLQSLHSFNEQAKSQTLVEQLLSGKRFALISDAGTPLISDPGFPLVRLARAHNVPVIPIPGPCALITALSASGLPTTAFCFEGFLPAKTSMRRSALQTLVKETRTLCFYESPHRLLDSLHAMQEVFGSERLVVVAKELTKTFEQFFEGTLASVIAHLQAEPSVVKGEFVIMVEGATIDASDNNQLEAILRLLLEENLSTKQAASIAVKLIGGKKNNAYQAALKLQADGLKPK